MAYQGYNSYEEMIAAMAKMQSVSVEEYLKNYLELPDEVKKALTPNEVEENVGELAKQKSKKTRLRTALVIGGLIAGTIITGGLVGAVASGAVALGAGAVAASAGISLSTAVGGTLIGVSALGGVQLYRTRFDRIEDKMMNGLAKYNTIERSLNERIQEASMDPNRKAELADLRARMAELMEDKCAFIDKYMAKVQKHKTSLLAHAGLRERKGGIASLDKARKFGKDFVKNNLNSLYLEEKQLRKERECDRLLNICYGNIGRAYDTAARMGLDMRVNEKNRFKKSKTAYKNDNDFGGTTKFEEGFQDEEGKYEYLNSNTAKPVIESVLRTNPNASIEEIAAKLNGPVSKRIYNSMPLECVIDMVNAGYNIKNASASDMNFIADNIVAYVSSGRINELSTAQQKSLLSLYGNDKILKMSVDAKRVELSQNSKPEVTKVIDEQFDKFNKSADKQSQIDKNIQTAKNIQQQRIADINKEREVQQFDAQVGAFAGRSDWNSETIKTYDTMSNKYINKTGLTDDQKNERAEQINFLGTILNAIQGGLDLSTLTKEQQKYIKESLGKDKQLIKIAGDVISAEALNSKIDDKEKDRRVAAVKELEKITGSKTASRTQL